MKTKGVENFREVLNQPTPSTLFSFDKKRPAATLNVTSEDISMAKVARAIKSLKNNKSPGLDGVMAELLKQGQGVVVESLTRLPNKANLAYRNNWRGITLLSIPAPWPTKESVTTSKGKNKQVSGRVGPAPNRSSLFATSSNSAKNSRHPS